MDLRTTHLNPIDAQVAEVGYWDGISPQMAAGPESETKKSKMRLRSLDFFAGSGLVSQGLQPYFTPVWANDNCAKKASVYTENHGTKNFHLDSICSIRGADLPQADLAWASFPCQDLSLAGMTAGIHAGRSGLVWEWLRVIDEMPVAPKVLVAENVLGLISTAKGAHYRALHEALVSRGYCVGAMIIDAARWIPQSRPRVFVVASKGSIESDHPLVSSTPTWLQTNIVSKAAIGTKDWVNWHLPMPPQRKKVLNDLIDWAAPFAAQEVQKRALDLISKRHQLVLNAITEDAPIAFPGYKRTRAGQQVLEVRFDDIAGCLRTPSGGSSRQLIIVKRNASLSSRLLTVREAARLMGAPESYKLPKNYNEGYKAMGDAVAVPVVKWLAKHLLHPLVQMAR